MITDGPYKILFPIGCRSDRGLVTPIIRRLKQDPAFLVRELNLIPMNFIESYILTDEVIRDSKPDLFFANADRVEMCGATAAAFHNKVKIAHHQAGIVNDPITTFDDIDRHVITLWSDIQFVENEAAYYTVVDLRGSVGLPLTGLHEVGITHLDDLEIDESKVPYKPVDILNSDYPIRKVSYDLVLYNTPTMEDYQQDIATIEILIDDHNKESSGYSVLVSGNPDGEAEMQLVQAVDEFHIDLPRPQFFGLLKNCQRFITNSSSAINEAPYFLKPEQIIMIGNRNRNRTPVECKSGGSDKIVKILEEYARKKAIDTN